MGAKRPIVGKYSSTDIDISELVRHMSTIQAIKRDFDVEVNVRIRLQKLKSLGYVCHVCFGLKFRVHGANIS